MENTEEYKCILSCQQGNAKSFEYLFKKYCQKGYRAALLFTRNPQDALDATQNAFIKAYTNINRFNLQYPFYPWFYKILRNCCYTLVSRKKHYEGEISDQYNMLLDPAIIAEKSEEQKQVLAALNKLAVDEREILYLKYFQDTSYKEIAAILEIPLGTVMSRLYTARVKLKKELE